MTTPFTLNVELDVMDELIIGVIWYCFVPFADVPGELIVVPAVSFAWLVEYFWKYCASVIIDPL